MKIISINNLKLNIFAYGSEIRPDEFFIDLEGTLKIKIKNKVHNIKIKSSDDSVLPLELDYDDPEYSNLSDTQQEVLQEYLADFNSVEYINGSQIVLKKSIKINKEINNDN